MVTLGRTIPALPARSVATAAAFYRDRFGFEVVHEDAGFAVLQRDGAQVHLWEAGDDGWRDRSGAEPVCSGAESFLAGTASCRIEASGIDELYGELREAGVLHGVSADGVVATQWGTREFATVDDDGNLLTFFEPQGAA